MSLTKKIRAWILQLLLVLFVSEFDVSSPLQQQLTNAWMAHLCGQNQRCPAFLQWKQEKNTFQHAYTWLPRLPNNTHTHKKKNHADSRVRTASQLRARQQSRELRRLLSSGQCKTFHADQTKLYFTRRGGGGHLFNTNKFYQHNMIRKWNSH